MTNETAVFLVRSEIIEFRAATNLSMYSYHKQREVPALYTSMCVHHNKQQWLLKSKFS